MRTAFVTLALATSFLIPSATSCAGEDVIASKTYITKVLNVNNFNAIDLSGSADITYRQDTCTHVEVYGSDNIVALLNSYVKDGTLYLRYKKSNLHIKGKSKLEYRISSPDVNKISLNGSGNILLANGVQTSKELAIAINGSGNLSGKTIHCNDLSVQVSGSGDIDLMGMHCNDLSVQVNGSGDIDLEGIESTSSSFKVSGSGDINLKGKAHDVNLRISGSGDINAVDLQAANLSASISGSGDISCYASERLKARISGSGSIGYKGNPQELDIPKKGVRKL
jgi:hypothetical protein